jgi:hypothetical protein
LVIEFRKDKIAQDWKLEGNQGYNQEDLRV